MTWQGPYRDGKVHVAADKCSTCIFRGGNLMRLAPGRVKDMVETSVRDGGAITCHKTLEYAGHGLDGAVCRGFADAHGDRVPALLLARHMGVIQEVPVP